jgi:ABC-type multidrug transport system permease subunit
MREYQRFLKASSAVVKIAAWIFLFLGILGGVSLFFGMVPGNPRWMGLIILAVYAFAFFFLTLIAKIADILSLIIKEIHKE